jgi:hypothetical protein
MKCFAKAEREYNTKVKKYHSVRQHRVKGSAKTQRGSTTRKSRSTTVCAATQSTGSPKTQKREYNTKATKLPPLCAATQSTGSPERSKGVQHESHEIPLCSATQEYRNRKNPCSVSTVYTRNLRRDG